MANEIFENRQHVTAILNYPFEQRTQPGFAHCFPVPFCKHRRRDRYISSKLFCCVPAQKQPIKEGRLALRELKILQRVFYRVGQSRHVEIAVYRFRLARQGAFELRVLTGQYHSPVHFARY